MQSCTYTNRKVFMMATNSALIRNLILFKEPLHYIKQVTDECDKLNFRLTYLHLNLTLN